MEEKIWYVEEYFEMAIEEQEYCEMYEPTYNPEDGNM